MIKQLIAHTEKHGSSAFIDEVVQEIMNKYTTQIGENMKDEGSVKEKQDLFKLETMMDLMSDEVIAQTLDRIKQYQKQVEEHSTKSKAHKHPERVNDVELDGNLQASQEVNNEKDEL